MLTNRCGNFMASLTTRDGEEEERTAKEEATRQLLRDWTIEYGRRALLEDLYNFGHHGPPLPGWLRSTKSNVFSNNDGVSAVHLGPLGK